MRHCSWWLAGTLALATVACSGTGAHTPLIPATDYPSNPAGANALGAVYQHDDLTQSALGLYTLEVDPESLAATVSLKATRAGQANDDLYALAIDNFLRPDSLRITGVASTPTTVNLTYSVTHPFPGPENPAGQPNGSTNRADLCITGFLCFLTDVASASGNTYFADRIANTQAIANPDAFFSPAGLITTSTTANTFPYKLLVDELADNRVGIPNGGDVTGNFGPEGWTRTELGVTYDGWRGYGLLAQGQTVTNMVALDRDELILNGFTLDVAVIAKYNDPRGGLTAAQKRANRLPPVSPDADLFAYRMPHGALDVQRITFLGEGGGFVRNQVSGSELRFHVEDWDARATETTEPDLAADAVVTNVEVGESGTPILSVSIPGVTGDQTSSIDLVAGPVDDDSAYGGDATEDSGMPGDALFYAETITKTVTSGQTSGDYTGLVRAADVNASAPFWVPLNEGTPPVPLTANLPVPITYQAFTVTLAPDATLPAGQWSIASNPVFDGGTASVTVSNVVDPDSATFDIEVDWGDGLGFVTAATGLTPGVGPFLAGPSPTYTLSNPSIAETRTLAVRLVDGTTLDSNPATNIGGDILDILPTPVAGGWVYLGTSTGTGLESAVSIDLDPAGNIYLCGLFNTGTNFGGGVRTPVSSTDGYLVKLNSAGVYQWDRTFGTTGNFESAYAVGADNAGNVWVGGRFSGTMDFGGGGRTADASVSTTNYEVYLAKYDTNGVYQWDVHSMGPGTSQLNGGLSGSNLAINRTTGEALLVGRFNRTENWGAFTLTSTGGATSNNNDPFAVKISPAGVVEWVWNPPAPDTVTESAWAAAVDSAGNWYIGGEARTGVNFGGGVRTAPGGFADSFIVKMTNAGAWIWDLYFGGAQAETVYGLAVDNSRIYATGDFTLGTNFGGGIRNPTTTGGQDPFVAAYQFDGTYVWDRTFIGSTASLEGKAVISNGTSVFAVGGFRDGTDFGLGPVTGHGTTSDDIYCVSLNAATGATNYVNTWGSTSIDAVRDIAVDASGDPYMAAQYQLGPIDWNPGAGVVNSTSSGNYDLAVVHWLDATNSF